MDKDLKFLVKQLVEYVGLYSAGLIIASILDSFSEMTKNGPFELRSLKLTFNNYFETEVMDTEGKR